MSNREPPKRTIDRIRDALKGINRKTMTKKDRADVQRKIERILIEEGR